MTPVEVISAKNSILSDVGFNIINPQWKILFDYYNNNLVDENNRPMSMNCMPCYHKVLYAVIKSINEEYLNTFKK